MGVSRLRLGEEGFWAINLKSLYVLIDEYQAIEYEQSRRLSYWIASTMNGVEIEQFRKAKEPVKTVHSFYFF